METSVPAAESASPDSAPAKDPRRELLRFSLLVGAGWLGTNLGLAVATDLPLKLLLKNQLHLSASDVAFFFFVGHFTNYIKPVAGILTDSVPLFGSRRRAYLILSLLGTGLGWLILALVPRRFEWLLVTYSLMYLTVVFTSSTLGGVMVEGGMRLRAAGRLTAQRIAMFRVGTLGGGPLGGALATLPFIIPAAVGAALHLVLVPLYYFGLREPRATTVNREAWREAGRQLRSLGRARLLWSAALMVFFIAASPGFNTPLLFYQTNTLRFSPLLIGSLASVQAAFGILAALFYHEACKRLRLRTLVAASIVVHAAGTLFYLLYRTPESAMAIAALEGVTITLATLPVYDLAARGTPRGSEALGYSVMMSVWNLTNGMSDVIGSTLFDRFHLTFQHLIWVNSGTTLLALLAVPFLPAALMDRKDGVETC